MNPEFVLRFLLCLVWPAYLSKFAYWLLQDVARKGDETSLRWLNDSIEEMRLAGRCFQPRRTVIPKTMTDAELRALQVPALFLMGDQERTFSYSKAVERLNRVAPDLEVQIIHHAGHALNSAQPELVNQRVLEFFRRS